MKILKKDLKRGRVSVAVENLDDLWHLSRIIDSGDSVGSRTTRKIKATEKETSRKTMFLEISVDAVEFKDQNLRISGRTMEEREDVPGGSHHTLTLGVGSNAVIVKEWRQYQLKRLQQASRAQAKTLVLVLDREEAVFALLKSQGYKVLAQMKGKVPKKGVETVASNFYRELADKLADYAGQHRTAAVIVASPAFWKEELLEEIKDEELRKKIVLAACSSVGLNALEEILRRPELKEALKQQRASEESTLVESLLTEIAKDGLAAYGKKDVADAISAGNAKSFLITDDFISKSRQAAEHLIKDAEAVKAGISIVNSENEAGRKLDSLGGIAVLLRYKAYR